MLYLACICTMHPSHTGANVLGFTKGHTKQALGCKILLQFIGKQYKSSLCLTFPITLRVPRDVLTGLSGLARPDTSQ